MNWHSGEPGFLILQNKDSFLIDNLNFRDYNAPTRVELLFRVLLAIGVLFRVGAPHSRVPLGLCIISSSCEDETQI